jgi:acyl-CoA synthetase (NDP forming)
VSGVSPWDSFLSPRTVAVVGASGDPHRIGGRLVRYSLESGYRGRVIPVNPNRSSVFDIPTIAGLGDFEGDGPDWVVVALPRDKVLGAVEEAGRVGARNVAVVAAGFAEQDEVGRQLQVELRGITSRYGMRLLGPNSNGFMNVHDAAFFAFTPVIDSARPLPGDIAVITQSAAIGTYLVNWFHTLGLGIRYWLHTGNEADVTVLELARAIAEREEVGALALCFETVRDLPDLRDTLALLASKQLPTGVLHAGVSETGKRASAAHTAALIGDEAEVITDLCASGGAFVAPSIGALANFIQVAVNHPRLPHSPRLGLVTTSGGVGVLMADAVDTVGLRMPALSQQLQEHITSYAPFAHVANPVDTTAQVINEPGAFERIVRDCVGSGQLDLVSVFIAHGLAGAKDSTLRQVVSVAETTAAGGANHDGLTAMGVFSTEAARALQAAGVSVFPEPAVLAGAVQGYGEARRRQLEFGQKQLSDGQEPAPLQPAQRELLDAMTADAGGGLVDELDAKQLLAAGGADVVAGSVVGSADQAVVAAEALGYPVVMKVVSRSIPHKHAQGALRLGLTTGAAVVAAFTELQVLVDAVSRDGASRARILVEQQVSGSEVFLSCVTHDELGMVIALGSGGSDIESRRDVRWLWPSVAPEEMAAVLDHGGPGAIRLSAGHASGLALLAGSMARLCAQASRLRTLEINPVMLTADGRVVVVDALIDVAAGPSSDEGDGW